VAIPTETVYGLAANAFDPHAVAQIFVVKNRPEFDPLIVHIHSVDWLERVATSFPPAAQKVAAQFWPGPLTLVLPKSPEVPDLVTSGLPTVGVRVPDHPLTRSVLERAGFPLAAPSANLFGRLSPTTVEHVLDQLGNQIDLILDGGPCRVGVESTILDFSSDEPVLLRPGGVPLEQVEPLVGPVAVPVREGNARPTAPGQLPSHYAPRTQLQLVQSVPEAALLPDAGALLARPRPLSGYRLVEVLSTSGDLAESATRLFPALHRLDAAQLQRIVAERLPDEGLGRAINDRLERAAHE
jgi:L-threonylcarbamoyladenylate synthase